MAAHVCSFPQAAPLYEAALSLHPEYPEGRANYGGLLVQLAELERAEVQYRRVLAAKPGHPKALKAMAFIKENMKKK